MATGLRKLSPAFFRRLAVALPGIWLGALLSLALLATPAGFALLAQADAGRLAARLLQQEAALSLFLGALVLVLERQQARLGAESGAGSQFSAGMVLALGTLGCTVVGYYVLQPLMVQARAGQGALSFAQLHLISGGFFAVKIVLVAALAWRAVTSR